MVNKKNPRRRQNPLLPGAPPHYVMGGPMSGTPSVWSYRGRQIEVRPQQHSARWVATVIAGPDRNLNAMAPDEHGALARVRFWLDVEDGDLFAVTALANNAIEDLYAKNAKINRATVARQIQHMRADQCALSRAGTKAFDALPLARRLEIIDAAIEYARVGGPKRPELFSNPQSKRRRPNPLRPEYRAALHPSDVRRLEHLEAKWREAARRAEAYYEAGELDLAAHMDARAEYIAETLEWVATAVDEDMEDLGYAGREADEVYVPPDPNEYFAAVYAEHVVGPSPRLLPEDVPRHLRGYLEESYWPTGARFDHVTDAQLLDAARDAYEARRALRERHLASAERHRKQARVGYGYGGGRDRESMTLRELRTRVLAW